MQQSSQPSSPPTAEEVASLKTKLKDLIRDWQPGQTSTLWKILETTRRMDEHPQRNSVREDLMDALNHLLFQGNINQLPTLLRGHFLWQRGRVIHRHILDSPLVRDSSRAAVETYKEVMDAYDRGDDMGKHGMDEDHGPSKEQIGEFIKVAEEAIVQSERIGPILAGLRARGVSMDEENIRALAFGQMAEENV